ncbi:ABC transporter permease [Salipiger sp.]|uniref:ABC transporter permease n=1 Tax=Salipiger sp. TaxID=2078585 RepID=UPI003A9698CB
MTQSATPALPPLPRTPARIPRRSSSPRVIAALMQREMSTTYGRSALGYLWAVLEPVGGIMVITLVFTLAFRSPPVGTSFPLFFASGVLPFTAFMDTMTKVSSAIRFSRPLLFYPGVTFMDAILARVLMNVLTQTMISAIVFTAILQLYDVKVILDLPRIIEGYAMAFAMGIGVGSLNAFLFAMSPFWERIWSVVTRPLFLISGVIILYDSIPNPYRDWLWWNPMVHVIGRVRQGIYATYDGAYVTPTYVLLVAGPCAVLGFLFLRRYHHDIMNM